MCERQVKGSHQICLKTWYLFYWICFSHFQAEQLDQGNEKNQNKLARHCCSQLLFQFIFSLTLYARTEGSMQPVKKWGGGAETRRKLAKKYLNIIMKYGQITGRNGGAVISNVASQQELWIPFWAWGLSVCSLHVLPVWVLYRFSAPSTVQK